MSQYQVTYESDLPGLESQVVSDPLSFEDAHALAVALNADEALEDGLSEPGYTVQPVTQN
jgi:hypothetical protein